jgi:hypothetical protein
VHRYTQAQIRFLEKKTAGRSYAELTALFNKRFGLTLTLSQIKGAIARWGLRNGRDCRFKPGQTPHNKGVKGLHYSRETEFRPGHKPATTRPAGSERVTADGYVEVKVKNRKKWKMKHVLLWEAAHGRVPRGHVVIFADGDRTRITPENLLTVSRRELAVMNHEGLISVRKDLTEAGKLIADIKLLIGDRKRGAKKKKKQGRRR